MAEGSAVPPPSSYVLEAFGAAAHPVRLLGGQAGRPVMNRLPRNPEPGTHIGHGLTLGKNRPNRLIPLLSHTQRAHPGSVTNQPKQL
jgi:hypothetical protein